MASHLRAMGPGLTGNDSEPFEGKQVVGIAGSLLPDRCQQAPQKEQKMSMQQGLWLKGGNYSHLQSEALADGRMWHAS